MRLAVEPAGERIRLAWAPDPGGVATLLPERAGFAGWGAFSVAEQVRRLSSAADPLREVVVLHPAHWPPASVRGCVRRLTGGSLPVRLQVSALAAAAEVGARAARPPGPLGVLQVGVYGSCATVLSECQGGTVLATRHHPATDGTRPVRVLASAADSAGVHPAELTGGVLLLTESTRAEALVEPINDLIGEPPVRPEDPYAVAVLGALRPAPADPAPGLPRSVWAASRPPTGSAAAGARGQRLARNLLPPPPPRRRARTVLTGLSLSLSAALVTASSTAAVPPIPAESGVAPDAGTPAGTLLAQYDYLFRLPAGWRHTGGLAERRRSLLTPARAPRGSDLIAVEQTPLGYNSNEEPDRAVRELRTQYQRGAEQGAQLTGFAEAAPLAGRRIVSYRQRKPELGAEVDWYVLFDRDAQLSVGCQHTASTAEAVRAACREVLDSLRLRP